MSFHSFGTTLKQLQMLQTKQTLISLNPVLQSCDCLNERIGTKQEKYQKEKKEEKRKSLSSSLSLNHVLQFLYIQAFMILIFTYFSFCNRGIFRNFKNLWVCSNNRNQCAWQIKFLGKQWDLRSLDPLQCQDHHHTWCFHKVKDTRIQMQSKGWCCIS